MKNLFTLCCCILVFNISWAQQKPQVVPGNIIVQIPDKSIDEVIAANQFFNGQPTGLKLNRLLSSPMAAYLLEFNENIHHEQFLQQLWDHPSVTLIQLNHYIQERNTTPDDPQFNQQWWHVNGGGGGGTADADIDSDEAWDITTGGLTALGDTIVVCVVDDGGDLTHPDLAANIWYNHHEIPDNNIDDDGNGYVDDYRGWDAANGDDNITGGGHGVNVAGMIGAVGDNNTGVVGVNWNVKIMTMQYGNIGSGSNPNEANVIEAYTYPLVMRRQYEQTNGALGAFVVATNSSWGIDNADPANAPLWCAFYDTLGAAGILSAGATANNNVNIDAVGDLPTACSSEYMISVTATNNNDVRTFSGYGATTVDLGAPGEDVRTTSSGGNYTTTSGTSFASPATAGAVALVYSAPCASLAAIAHSDPALAAEMVRDAIFNGVDPVANLNGECVTGGRLNTKGALDEIINNCSAGGCLPPFNVMASNILDISADVSWGHLANIDTFNVSYGQVGGSATDVMDLTDDTYGLTGLTACTDYWFVAQSVCDGASGDWSDTLYFETDGCCEPPSSISIGSITDSTATATWNAVLAAEGYYLEWGPVINGTWTEQGVGITTSFELTGLEPCTTYEVQVSTICNGDTTNHISSEQFTTSGCGACTDLTYCASTGNVQDEYIGNVTVDVLDNTSGAGPDGYEDNTSTLSVDLQRDETYPVSFTPAFTGSSFTEHFRLWIDLDQNGTFSNSEMLFDDTDGGSNTVTDSITIPLSAELGSTRMRVSMAYGGQFGGAYPQTPCDELTYGEVEDYCVNILEEEEDSIGDGILENSGEFGMEVYPVPAMETVMVEMTGHSTGRPLSLQIIDMTGRVVALHTMETRRQLINVSDLSKGIYMLQAVNKQAEPVGRVRIVKE